MEGLGSMKEKFLEAGLRDLYFETQEEVVDERQKLIGSIEIFNPRG